MEEMRGWHSGKIRRLFKNDCEVCEVYFWVPKHLFEKSRYCSFKCASQGKQRRVELHCAECGKSIWKSASKLANSKSGFVFCNRLCKETAQQTGGRVPGIQPAHYREMHGRAFLIRTRGHRCEICKLEEWLGQPIALERDHIDGDSANNTESNLRLLCPNCHAQTPTFCGRNRGRGRKSLRGNLPSRPNRRRTPERVGASEPRRGLGQAHRAGHAAAHSRRRTDAEVPDPTRFVANRGRRVA